MTNEFSLEEVDVDGAVRETREEAIYHLDKAGDTRADFLRKAAVGGGAVAGGGALIGMLAPSALAAGKGRPPAKPFGKGDIGIGNFALVLEYLESAFYNEATKNQERMSFLKNPQLQVFLRTVTIDENRHVGALKALLGAKAVKRPQFNFRGDTANEGQFVKNSFIFENTGVHAYSGQAFNIKSAKILKAALSIVTIEARHAAVIGLIGGESVSAIAPNGAFDTPYTAKKVLAGVKKLNYITKL